VGRCGEWKCALYIGWGGPSTGPTPFYCSGVSVLVCAAGGRLLGGECVLGLGLTRGRDHTSRTQFSDGVCTKGIRAHSHKELIRECQRETGHTHTHTHGKTIRQRAVAEALQNGREHTSRTPFSDGVCIKGTRAHTHRELIRECQREPGHTHKHTTRPFFSRLLQKPCRMAGNTYQENHSQD